MSLLYSVETCLRATRIPPSRFGREAVKDPRLVHDLRQGRQPGAALERRVRKHIAETLLRHGVKTMEAAVKSAGLGHRPGSLPAGMMQGDC